MRPDHFLKAEGFCALVASVALYSNIFPHHWLLYAGLFLVPDLTLIPYVQGPSAARSQLYNLAHTYALPLALANFALLTHNYLAGQCSLIWIGHIGLDRMLGFGLKYPQSFKATHIQSSSRPPNDPTLLL